jgi:hypothetical protein
MSGEKELTNLTVAVEIERLLSGASDGAALFQALYGAVADEPVPERLLAVVRECCEPAIEPEAVPTALTTARRATAS